MAELYEIIFKVAIEKVEPPPEELSGLLSPIRTPAILPIGSRAVFSPEALKDAEALSALFKAAEEKLMEKIIEELNTKITTCNTGGKNP